MTSDPIELLKETIPKLFNAAFAEIRAQAESGSAEAQQKRNELQQAAPLAVRIVLEGKAKQDVYLVFEKGELKAQDGPSSVPSSFAFGVAQDAFEIALEDLAGELERGLDRLKKRIPQLSPSRARNSLDRLANEKLLFHYVVKDTPDFEEVRVKVALGGSEPPERPAFTVTLDHALIEQLRAKKLKVQGLLSKLQLSGDSSRAMQLVMGALQRRS